VLPWFLATSAVQPLPLLLDPLVQVFTLEIIALSAYYIYRQKMTAYGYTKGLLLADYVLFAGVMAFEFLRTAVFTVANFQSSGFAFVYTVGGTDLILASVVVLTVLAVSVYLVPSGIGSKRVARLLWDRKLHVALLGAYTAFVAYAGAYVTVEEPFSVQQIPSITGVTLPATAFDKPYLEILLVVLLVFILYPSLLLILASRKAKDPAVRRVLRVLPVVWTGIGVDLLVFNGYLLSINIDATAFGYLIAAAAFGATAFLFRRASLLTAFFEPVRGTRGIAAEFPFTDLLGVPGAFMQGRTFLLETDPSVPYEQIVTDFSRQCISNNNTVYVFTAKGSPVYNALHTMEGVRFYILSARVSYPKPEDNEPSQILIPSNDQAVILDLIDKTLSAVQAPSQVAIVFDSISDMVLSTGFEGTYKFVKQVNETTGNGRTTSLFLMTLGAHDEKVVSFVRSLFPTQLVDDATGLRVTRSQ
jgi:hypothetical protein